MYSFMRYELNYQKYCNNKMICGNIYAMPHAICFFMIKYDILYNM